MNLEVDITAKYVEKLIDQMAHALGLAHRVAGCWVGCHVTDCEDPELHIDSTPDFPTRSPPSRHAPLRA